MLKNIPKGETVKLLISKAFDLKVTEDPLKVLSRKGRKVSEYRSKIGIKNTSQQDKTVYLDCQIRAEGEWTLKSRPPYEKTDAMNVCFTVKIPAGETTTVEYEVKGGANKT